MRKPGSITFGAVLVILTSFPASAQEMVEPWTPEIGGQHYFAVSVQDVDRSVEWYQTVFGLRLLDDTSGADDAWRIANLTSELLWVEIIRDDRALVSTQRTKGISKFGFLVADVGAVADRIEAATGDRPRLVPVERHGIEILQLRDPDGNTIQVYSRRPAE